MASTFIIAEAGSTWECNFWKLKRLAYAVKQAGADVLKLQWTSSGLKMAERRGLPIEAAKMYHKHIQYHPDHLPKAKEIIEGAGLEFMCTVYLIEDIPVIIPLVSKFKVSAFESQWGEFINAHPKKSTLFVSVNPGKYSIFHDNTKYLHCISEYPTPLEHLELNMLLQEEYYRDGLSDHTGHTMTGAMAVIAGAKIIEAHVRLHDTPKDNPDFRHSLRVDGVPFPEFNDYVENIRVAEKML